MNEPYTMQVMVNRLIKNDGHAETGVAIRMGILAVSFTLTDSMLLELFRTLHSGGQMWIPTHGPVCPMLPSPGKYVEIDADALKMERAVW